MSATRTAYLDPHSLKPGELGADGLAEKRDNDPTELEPTIADLEELNARMQISESENLVTADKLQPGDFIIREGDLMRVREAFDDGTVSAIYLTGFNVGSVVMLLMDGDEFDLVASRDLE